MGAESLVDKPMGVFSGFGMNVPKRVVSNEHFASYLETNDEWIVERTGISERRWVEEGESLVSLSEPACVAALKNAGIGAEELDGIIVATSTPDNAFPSTACELQGRLGAVNAFGFDLAAACSGFLYAVFTAQSLMRSGAGNNFLVVGAEIFSRVVDEQDRGTCILFGDGAGAAVLTSEAKGSGEGRGIIGGKVFSDGKLGETLFLPCAGKERKPVISMAGRDVFKSAVRSLAESSLEVLEEAGYKASDIDHYVSHQANKRILQAVGKQMSLDEKKVHLNVSKYGNTSAASLPLLLTECVEGKKINPGDLVMLSAYGGGATWGALLMKW